MISVGVFLGAPIPVQLLASYPETNWPTVVISGSAAELAAAIVRRRLLGHPYSRLLNFGAGRNAWTRFRTLLSRAAPSCGARQGLASQPPQSYRSLSAQALRRPRPTAASSATSSQGRPTPRSST